MAALPGGHFFCAFPDGPGYVPPSGKARRQNRLPAEAGLLERPGAPRPPIDPAIFRFFAHRRAIF